MHLSSNRRDGTLSAGIDGRLYDAHGYFVDRSDDTGRTWNRIVDVNTGAARRVVTLSNGDVMAVVGYELCISTDGGTTWDSLGVGFENIAETPTGAILGGDRFTTWRSTDHGASWTVIDSLQFAEMVVGRDGSLYAVEQKRTSLLRRGVYRSTDDGRSWRRISSLRIDHIAVQSSSSIWWTVGAMARHAADLSQPGRAVAYGEMTAKGELGGVAMDPDGLRRHHRCRDSFGVVRSGRDGAGRALCAACD